MMAGKDQEWINVYVHGQYGFVQDGKPVWGEYKDDKHHTDEDIVIPESWTIHVGLDFGLTPAAIFGARSPTDQVLVFDELIAEDMDAKTFGRLLKQKILTEYPNQNLSSMVTLLVTRERSLTSRRHSCCFMLLVYWQGRHGPMTQ